MTSYWAKDLIQRGGHGEDDASQLTYLALNVVKTCRFAVHNDSTNEQEPLEKIIAIAASLEVVEFILNMAGNTTERLEFDRRDA